MASTIKVDTIQSTTSNVIIQNSAGTEYARFDATGVFQLANPTTFPAGTAAAPSITATGDTNTGIFFPAADTIGFAEGGVEAMRINSSGNVGIGTSSFPSTTKLVVQGESNTNPTTFWSYGYIANGAADTRCGTIRNGFDTNTDFGTYWTSFRAANGTSYQARFGIRTSGTDLDVMTIDSSGNLLVGTTANAITAYSAGKSLIQSADYSGAVAQLINSTSTTGTQYFLAFGRGASVCGQITSGSTNSTSFTTSSDYRLKKDVQPITGALAKVQTLKPCTYKWVEDNTISEGFIAHELAETFPQAVVGEKDAVNAEGNPVYQGVDTSFLVATLTAAIQELKVLTDTQASTITALTARITALENT